MSELTINPIDEARQSVTDAFGENSSRFDLEAHPTIDVALFDEMNADATRVRQESTFADNQYSSNEFIAKTEVSPEVVNPIEFIARASARISHERDQYGHAA